MIRFIVWLAHVCRQPALRVTQRLWINRRFKICWKTANPTKRAGRGEKPGLKFSISQDDDDGDIRSASIGPTQEFRAQLTRAAVLTIQNDELGHCFAFRAASS